MPFLTRKNLLKAKISPAEDIVDVEVGWYLRVIAIDRAQAAATLQVVSVEWSYVTWVDRLRGRKPEKIIRVV